MPIDISPRVDIVFRVLFGSADHTDLLLDLLNSVLRPLTPVVAVELDDPFVLPDQVDDKLVVVDLKATDASGRVFQVEMQALSSPQLRAQMLFSWASLYRQQLAVGAPFSALRPVIAVWFCDRDVLSLAELPASRPWHSRWELREAQSRARWSEHCELHVVELGRWRREKSALDPSDRWVRFLAEAERWDTLPVGLEGPLMEKAMRVLDRFATDKHQRALYEARLNADHLEATWREAVRQAQAERDAAQAERDAAEAKLDAAEAKVDAAEAERDTVAAKLDAEARARAEAEAELTRLRAILHDVAPSKD